MFFVSGYGKVVGKCGLLGITGRGRSHISSTRTQLTLQDLLVPTRSVSVVAVGLGIPGLDL